MAYTTIDDPAQYFNTVLYTGNDSTQSITGVGFQPDFVWKKERDSTSGHQLTNAVRGTGRILRTGNTDAELVNAQKLTSFDNDGFSLGSNKAVNQSGISYVSWNWLAGNSASSNSDGDITSSVSANTTAGFSIGTFTKGSGTQTVGHGLGKKPTVFWVKRTDGTGSWYVYHDKNTGAPETDYLRINSTDGTADNATVWGDTAPTSSVFSISTAFNSSEELVFFAFTDIKGYSKFGSYTGNGDADGTFVYTGFRPAWLLVKDTGGNGENWELLDATRSPFNVADERLKANSSDAESTGSNYFLDFLSNGFKQRNSQTSSNGSGETYIYMAFAESPFVNSNGVPTNAR